MSRSLGIKQKEKLKALKNVVKIQGLSIFPGLIDLEVGKEEERDFWS